MKAIILAAGRGSRMKNLTNERPKCLVKLNGKTLLDWQLEAIHKTGINDIAIVTGYKREMLINRGLIEFNNSRWAESNMVSSLACAEEWLEKDICIVSYSDIFYEFTAIEALKSSKSKLAVTYDVNWLQLWTKRFKNPLIDAETFRLDESNCLIEIGQKPESVEEIQGQYMGLLRFTPDAWDKVVKIRNDMTSKDAALMHMTGTLQKIIQANCFCIKAIPYSGEWGEIDSPQDLSVYQ